FYYAHGAHLARQTLANTFEQVLQVCLQVLSALLNRLNARILGVSTRYSVAQYLAALRRKNNQLSPLIPVTEVQPTATLSTDCGRKQTRDVNFFWLDDHICFGCAPKLLNRVNYSRLQEQATNTRQSEITAQFTAVILSAVKTPWAKMTTPESVYAINHDGYRKFCQLMSAHIEVAVIYMGQAQNIDSVMQVALKKQQANLSPVNQVTGKIAGLLFV
ncbi:MAG: hypothetical protein ACI88A_004136, partial [Paraglaciecola sp.]